MLNPASGKLCVGILEGYAQRGLAYSGLLAAEAIDVVSFDSADDWTAMPPPGLDCLLVDLTDEATLEAVLAESGDCPVVCIGERISSGRVSAAMRRGAVDVIDWSTDQARLTERLLSAAGLAAERRALSNALAGLRRRVSRLTHRQAEVIGLVALGHPNKIISGLLGISERTVEVHRASAMRRLEADSLAQAIVMMRIARCFPDGPVWALDRWGNLQSLLEPLAGFEDAADRRRVA